MIDSKQRFKLDIALFFIPIILIVYVSNVSFINSDYTQSKMPLYKKDAINKSQVYLLDFVQFYNAYWFVIMNLPPLIILYLLSFTLKISNEASSDASNVLGENLQFDL